MFYISFVVLWSCARLRYTWQKLFNLRLLWKRGAEIIIQIQLEHIFWQNILFNNRFLVLKDPFMVSWWCFVYSCSNIQISTHYSNGNYLVPLQHSKFIAHFHGDWLAPSYGLVKYIKTFVWFICYNVYLVIQGNHDYQVNLVPFELVHTVFLEDTFYWEN